MKKKRSTSGFKQENKINQNSSVEEYILKREWSNAIEYYEKELRRKTTPEMRKKLLSGLEKQGIDAALQNNDLAALKIYCKIIAIDKNNTTNLRNFSIVLRRSGQYQSAISYIKKCLKIKPDCPDALNTYGTILADLGKNEEAIKAFKKAVSLEPLNSNVNNNLANQYHLNAKIDLAFIYSSRSLLEQPNRSALMLDHLTHINRVCDHDRLDKINWWEVINQVPAAWRSSSFLQYLTLSESEEEHKLLRNCIEEWGNSQSKKAIEQPISKFAKPRITNNDPLRVGFISADFRDHSVARFIWPLFEHLDQSEFLLFCYSTVQEQDQWRDRFIERSTKFTEVHKFSPQELSEIIRKDEIHVLFDLTGFTNGSRTGSLAWRAAPAQVSWLGFPGTSGLEAMDYLFMDKYLKPSDLTFITEKPLLIDGTTVCFSEIDPVPITSTIPENIRGYLTFGSLNNSYKMTRKTIQRWSSILQALPDSRIVFIRREFESHFLRENILKVFEKCGITSNRVHFYNNRLENRHYLDCYNEIDITLDTFPVTGGTTTTDALWMGVPVVALEGTNIHQRVCSAILQHAGHPEWIARNDEEYKQIAISLAKNQDLRIKLRQNLRKEIQKCPLCDSKTFAKNFSACMKKLKEKIT